MVDEIITKIAENTELDEDEVRTKVEEKADEFSGLVSEEGAAHLVAREHGLNLASETEKDLKVESVVPGMNRVNLKAQVVNITEPNTFERDDGDQGKVQNLILGDETGTVRMSLWDEQTEVAEKIDEGDNIQISNGYTKEDNRGDPELRLGDSTKIKRIDDDEIQEVQQQNSSGGGNYEKVHIDEIADENANYEFSGTVIQLYTDNPFYRVCPECGETLREDDDYTCDEHGDVEPEYRLALPAIIDDGFGNIRCVFFRDTAKKLLDAEDEEFQGNSRKVQDHAKKAAGKRVRVQGRAKYNDFFETIEVLVNDVETQDIEEAIRQKVEAMTDE
ncbi:MAG: DUF2240 family protein [Candidatus Nanohaloarchaea archaeon]|nr:DUF2240 family protein [Candidatus Nanohaloarchaea archaeon]